MGKKILLINPPLLSRDIEHPANYLDSLIAAERDRINRHIFRQFIRPVYDTLGIDKTFFDYPKHTASLGLLSMAAVLRLHGNHVTYVQAHSDPSDLARLADLAEGHDIAGVTAMCTTIDIALEILSAIKSRLGNRIVTVLGGSQVTHAALHDIRAMSGADIVVRGEGEEVVTRIAEDPFCAKHLAAIPGLVFRSGDEVTPTPGINRLTEASLQTLPPPAYDLIPDLENTQIYIQCSRGCNHSCRFCSEHAKTRYFSRKQIEALLRTLEMFRKRNLVFIVDNDFADSPESLDDFERAVADSGATNYFYAQARIRGQSEERLRRLYQSRVINYFFGIENTSDHVLKSVNKRQTWTDILAGLRAAHAFFKKIGYEIPPYRANFIQGLPGENGTESALNLDRRKLLLQEGLMAIVHDNVFQPTPGSLFYQNPEKYGIKLPEGYRTGMRWALPDYDMEGTSASPMFRFLHHLEMRQIVNDFLIEKFRLESIGNETKIALMRGKFLENAHDGETR